jgi:hypothetical protein
MTWRRIVAWRLRPRWRIITRWRIVAWRRIVPWRFTTWLGSGLSWLRPGLRTWLRLWLEAWFCLSSSFRRRGRFFTPRLGIISRSFNRLLAARTLVHSFRQCRPDHTPGTILTTGTVLVARLVRC